MDAWQGYPSEQGITLRYIFVVFVPQDFCLHILWEWVTIHSSTDCSAQESAGPESSVCVKVVVSLVVGGESSRRGSLSSNSRGPSHPLDIFHIFPVILVHPHLLNITPSRAASNRNSMNNPQWNPSPEGGLVGVNGNLAFTLTSAG